MGLLHLINPKTSELHGLKELVMVSCDIDHTQTYMISNDRLENGKCPFRLTSLNVSHNKLSLFVNYLTELDLITSELERLYLVNCLVNDEHIINLIQSEKLQKLEHLDLTSN